MDCNYHNLGALRIWIVDHSESWTLRYEDDLLIDIVGNVDSTPWRWNAAQTTAEYRQSEATETLTLDFAGDFEDGTPWPNFTAADDRRYVVFVQRIDGLWAYGIRHGMACTSRVISPGGPQSIRGVRTVFKDDSTDGPTPCNIRIAAYL